MADWEQPSTSMLFKAAGGRGPDEQLTAMRQELSAALERIQALEQRVTELEALLTDRGHAQGA